MKKFVVEGTAARFGEGAILGLNKAQFAARAHNVEKLRVEGNVIVVRASRPLEFKIGEELRLEGDEPKGLTDPMSGKSVSKKERKAKAATVPKTKNTIASAVKALNDAEADAAEAQVKLDSAAPEDRVAAQQALDDAKAAVASAQEALTKAGD